MRLFISIIFFLVNVTFVSAWPGEKDIETKKQNNTCLLTINNPKRLLKSKDSKNSVSSYLSSEIQKTGFCTRSSAIESLKLEYKGKRNTYSRYILPLVITVSAAGLTYALYSTRSN